MKTICGHEFYIGGDGVMLLQLDDGSNMTNDDMTMKRKQNSVQLATPTRLIPLRVTHSDTM